MQAFPSKLCGPFLRFLRHCIVTLVVLSAMLITMRSKAQSTFGEIVGVVTDPSGAVVAGADITVTDTATDVMRAVVSGEHGDFSLVNLDASIYVVTVKAPGFMARQFSDVHVLARQTVRVDAAMKVGTASAQTVQVTAGGEDIDADLTVGNSKSGQQIDELALNFRASSATSPIIVANLAPQVQPDQSGNISIAGGLPNMTSFSLDGISTQNVRVGGPNQDLFPSVESIAEFQVNTGSNNAEFGQASDLTVISKSGGNAYHGSLFYFTQNAAFNAADPFAHRALPVVANDFGGTVGGPATLPRVYNAKERTFFFFTYEGTRRPQSFPVNEILPSTTQRAGIMSHIVRNPCTGEFTNDVSNCINPASAAALDAFFPMPNVVNGPDDAINQFVIPGRYSLDGYDVRGDQVLGDRQKFFVRFSRKNISNSGDNGDGSYNPLMGPFDISQKLRNLAGSYNWIITPRVVNEIRAGLSFVTTAEVYPQAAQGAALDTSIGIAGLPPAPSSGGVPNFQVGNYVDPAGAVFGSAGTNSFGRPRHVQQHIYEAADNVTLTVGRHSLKFGGAFTHTSFIDQITFTIGDDFGDYYYSGAFTGDPLADFLAGIVSQADYAANGPDGKPYASHYGFFGQDDWKLNPRLTVSYGLRYEINPPFNDETHQLAQFDKNFPGGRIIVQGQTGLGLIAASFRQQVGNTPFVTNDAVHLPTTLRNTYYGNIQPRLGFAYDVYGNGKTVVKAHAGSYSVPVLGAVLYSLMGITTSNFPVFESTATNPIFFPDVFGGAGAFLTNCNTPSEPPPGTTVVIPSCPGYRRANDENLKDPRVIQWNGSVEQEVGHNTVARLLYTGSHATQLIYSPDLNQVQPNTVGYAALTATPALRQQNLKYPNFSEVLTRDNGPSAKYNALTAELQRRFGHGLTFDASYTWAKNRSNALGSAPSSLIGQGGQGDNGPNALDYFDIHRDYGNVNFTRRNRFVNTFNYKLPLGRGERLLGRASRSADLIAGGWNLTGITVLQTGAFLTPTFNPVGDDPSGTNPGQRSAGGYQRPDCVAGQNPNTRTVPGRYFNPNAFSVPGSDIGRFGNCGVGIMPGPGTTSFSASIGKEFAFTERLRLRYEADFSNLFNIENLANPETQITSGSFGQISAVQAGEQAGPRTIQMSLRLAF